MNRIRSKKSDSSSRDAILVGFLPPAVILWALPYVVSPDILPDVLNRYAGLREMIELVGEYFPVIERLVAVSPYPPDYIKVVFSLSILLSPLLAIWLSVVSWILDEKVPDAKLGSQIIVFIILLFMLVVLILMFANLTMPDRAPVLRQYDPRRFARSKYSMGVFSLLLGGPLAGLWCSIVNLFVYMARWVLYRFRRFLRFRR